MISLGGNANVANWSLELDSWVGWVVSAGWMGLTSGTEVSVMADSTLVASSLDVSVVVLILANWTIAVNTEMLWLYNQWQETRTSLVDLNKSMTCVNKASILDAAVAVIPVWTVDALVTNTMDVIVAAIANGVVFDATAWPHHLGE